jgi:maltose alpha-D-glucosyltransferase/alpha-amylase
MDAPDLGRYILRSSAERLVATACPDRRSSGPMKERRTDAHDSDPLGKDPLWYKHAIVYELHVRAFHDSTGDGVGDFRGLTQKLDYLSDLGVTTLWLLPFYPSPLKDDGYDISDYYSIHPSYGTIADFKTFLREAHRRGLRVITELVLNHTSDQHPWFQLSRRGKPGSRWRDYYVWSDSAGEYKDARIIFKDFEASNWTWDPVANAYFWHRFYSHQPDLNYQNPHVHKEVLRILDFWLDMGVDGLRLDAVPYLYEREGTNCENLPETHELLKKLRRHVDERYGDRVLLAEANQWPEDAVAYFGAGEGDECHMAFHFPLMPRIFMGVRMEDRVPIVDILQQTPPIPKTAQWGLFLRNHDELTLEMVTDEERDYMYRVYAHDQRARINLGIRRRLAPLLGNDRKRIELLNALLVSLPGTPVLYYGDEIGMGENIFLGDRNGVRTPMQWSADRNAGFSRANPQSLYLPVIVDPEYHYETSNVETQQRNLHSLLWWMKRLLSLRKRWRAFGEGAIEFLFPANRKILAFIRSHGEERILVVANLSRFVQPVELDLSAYARSVPVEIFGRNRFPAIAEAPYFLTLSPHAFFMFSLEPRRVEGQVVGPAHPAHAPGEGLPALTSASEWSDIQGDEPLRLRLEGILPSYLKERRWFGGKAKEITRVSIAEMLPVSYASGEAFLAILEVDYVQHDAERYQLPLAFSEGEDGERLVETMPHLAIARLRLPSREGVLHDALASEGFCRRLLEIVGGKKRLRGAQGALIPSQTPTLKALREAGVDLKPSVGSAEQTNSAIIYSDRLILKLFRKLEEGTNPDLEIGRLLTAKRFPNTPRVAGSLEHLSERGEATTLAIVHAFVPESKDAWTHTLDLLGRYFERVLALPAEELQKQPENRSLRSLVAGQIPQGVEKMLGLYPESARLLGRRTAELHKTLASEKGDPQFAPEPFTPHYQRSLYQSMRSLTAQNFRLLRSQLRSLPEAARHLGSRVADLETECERRFRGIRERKIRGMRIRCHGDYHLGQVLYTGKDFHIIDFEGEPARALSERKIKRSPLRDVAGMLRSFHYAAHKALGVQEERGNVTAANRSLIEPWARYWYAWVAVLYLQTYLECGREAGFLPSSDEEIWTLLEGYLLEKAIYELGYELNNRPDWVTIPLEGILDLLEKA